MANRSVSDAIRFTPASPCKCCVSIRRHHMNSAFFCIGKVKCVFENTKYVDSKENYHFFFKDTKLLSFCPTTHLSLNSLTTFRYEELVFQSPILIKTPVFPCDCSPRCRPTIIITNKQQLIIRTQSSNKRKRKIYTHNLTRALIAPSSPNNIRISAVSAIFAYPHVAGTMAMNVNRGNFGNIYTRRGTAFIKTGIKFVMALFV